jgi:hypothetical protein
MARYRVLLNGGDSGSDVIVADSAAGAMQQAIEWAKDGDWTYPTRCRVYVENTEDQADWEDTTIKLEEPEA